MIILMGKLPVLGVHHVWTKLKMGCPHQFQKSIGDWHKHIAIHHYTNFIQEFQPASINPSITNRWCSNCCPGNDAPNAGGPNSGGSHPTNQIRRSCLDVTVLDGWPMLCFIAQVTFQEEFPGSQTRVAAMSLHEGNGVQFGDVETLAL